MRLRRERRVLFPFIERGPQRAPGRPGLGPGRYPGTWPGLIKVVASKSVASKLYRRAVAADSQCFEDVLVLGNDAIADGARRERKHLRKFS